MLLSLLTPPEMLSLSTSMLMTTVAFIIAYLYTLQHETNLLLLHTLPAALLGCSCVLYGLGGGIAFRVLRTFST